MGPGGAMEGLDYAVAKGIVRHPAFSSHNPMIARKMMLTGRFQVVQFPFNFIDTKAQEELIPLADKMNMGFICMKPLGGGLLDDADLCFRYLMQFKNIVPDPGIEKSEEMKEILSIIRTPSPLSDYDETRIEEKRKELGDRWCHRCGYCQPCPQDIKIGLVLIAKSIVKRMPYDAVCSFLEEAMADAKNCSECRECIEKCPYNLNIPELLKKNQVLWEEYKQTRNPSVFY
jgi:predicted aldo/keto reductase-like oxidoreductase